MKTEDICTCSCHVKGETVLHYMPCCQFTYEKYINKDGTIDLEAYNTLVKTSKVITQEMLEKYLKEGLK